MNILFLTLSSNIVPKDDDGIYSSVLYELSKNNNLYIVSPTERRYHKNTYVINEKNNHILKVKIGNITKCKKIEKGISTLLIQKQYKTAIKNNFKNIKFDIILYSTPPITFYSIINYFKKRDNARTYLMLKDIFPQNAVDMKMFGKKSILYKYFRNQEKKLYKISDKIGCMSPKNREYILKNNKYLEKKKVEIFPNSVSINSIESEISEAEISKLKKKYNIPYNSRVFLYGGNLGKPQGIDFLIKCLESVTEIDDIFFIICGTGTYYNKLKSYVKNSNHKNILLINGLPKKEYNRFINVADVGLIFLDYNFTIPNFPSRLLSYMISEIPILSCTDPNTDVGEIVENNGFGWKCLSNDVNAFKELIIRIISMDNKEIKRMGKKGKEFLINNYLSNMHFKKIISESDAQ